MKEAVIVSAVRTPVGRFAGALKHMTAEELLTLVIKEAIHRAGIPHEALGSAEDVIIGNVANSRGNIARYCLLAAGLPVHVPGVTLDRQCASGLEAINQAYDKIRSGSADFIIAGGVEQMTLTPYQLNVPSSAYQRFPSGFVETKFAPDTVGDPPMGITAENIADRYHVKRTRQDEFALMSHMRAIAAIDAGRFDDEIVPVTFRDKKGREIVFETDEHPRRDTSLERLAGLRPAFRKEGSVTAGNSSGINDGAACLIVMSKNKAEELNLSPLATICGYATVGVDPNYMGIGPVFAIRKLMERTGQQLNDIGLFEINEAFASQIVYVIDELGLNRDIVNVNGGAIALGHPLGCTGAKLTTTLIHEMRKRRVKKGVVSLCVAGGQGSATLLEIR